MGFLSSLFGKKKEEKINEVKSTSPEFVDGANMIYRKEYGEAVKELTEQLNKTDPDDVGALSMIHINLMEAYRKGKDLFPESEDKIIYHAKQALINGHNTGFAFRRLLINFEKQNKLKHAIQIAEFFSSKEYSFSEFYEGNKPELEKRLIKYKSKLEKIGDVSEDVFLTDDDKRMIITNTRRLEEESKRLYENKQSDEDFLKSLEDAFKDI